MTEVTAVINGAVCVSCVSVSVHVTITTNLLMIKRRHEFRLVV